MVEGEGGGREDIDILVRLKIGFHTEGSLLKKLVWLGCITEGFLHIMIRVHIPIQHMICCSR